MDKSKSDDFENDNPSGLTPSQLEIVEGLNEATARLATLIFNSDPLKHTYRQLRIPLVIREPGCWFSAGFGEGKTSAVAYCVAALRKEFKGLPVYLINEYVLPSNELKSFFLKALQDSGHAFPDGTYMVKLRNRLSSY